MATSQASRAGTAAGSRASCFWRSAKVFSVLEQVQRVVRARPVGAEADADAAPPRLEIGKHPAHRELQVGDRVGHDGGAALGDQLELRIVQPHAVGEHRSRPEQPEPVEVLGGPHAVRSETQRVTSSSVSERWIWTGSPRFSDASAIHRRDGSLTV